MQYLLCTYTLQINLHSLRSCSVLFSSFWSRNRFETGTASILSQQKDTDIYAEERKLLKHQEQRMDELKMRQHEEKVKLEEEFSAEFVRLMEKRNPH